MTSRINKDCKTNEKQLEKQQPTHLWKPGQSGNPNGRPKRGNTMADLLRKCLEAEGKNKLTAKQEIIEKLLDLAKNGDMVAIKTILERIDGKAIDKMEINMPRPAIIEAPNGKQEILGFEEDE